jgi:hypothetical protein
MNFCEPSEAEKVYHIYNYLQSLLIEDGQQ